MFGWSEPHFVWMQAYSKEGFFLHWLGGQGPQGILPTTASFFTRHEQLLFCISTSPLVQSHPKLVSAYPCTSDSTSSTDWKAREELWHPGSVSYLINVLLIRDSCSSNISVLFLLLPLEERVLLDCPSTSLQMAAAKGSGCVQTFPLWTPGDSGELGLLPARLSAWPRWLCVLN